MSEAASNLILGIVQGVTEWLPISSSGHLALIERLLGLQQDLAYDLFLHLASLLVMIAYFRSDLARILKGAVQSGSSPERTMAGYIVLATVATVIIALFLSPYESGMRNIPWIAASLLVNAVILYCMRFHREERQLSAGVALIVGIAQGIAAIPAISRSALTIGVAVLLGIKSEEAFRFSFLIAIPAIAGAVVYTLPSLQWNPTYAIGFVATGIAGYASLWILERIMKKNKMHLFWMYNAVLAMLIMLYA